MTIQLVGGGWDRVLIEAAKADGSALRIVCPFIQVGAIKRLLRHYRSGTVQVLTRFDLADFHAGVNDLAALRLLLDANAQIRGVKNLHSKLYLFGNSQAIVTSANLTEQALFQNHEFGFLSCASDTVAEVRAYFDFLWDQAGANLSPAQLDDWERRVLLARRKHPPASPIDGLNDHGTSVPIVLPSTLGESPAPQAFIKFFGRGQRRRHPDTRVLDTVAMSGSNWALSYPKGKRPRIVQTGAIMFMGDLVGEDDAPNDILIYGRAVAIAHEPGRDDATKADIRKMKWKADWPHYIRVEKPEFVQGTLRDCVSLNRLMDELGAEAFASTQANAHRGEGNTNPRMSYRRQAAVRLSPDGYRWVTEQLEAAFAARGKIPLTELAAQGGIDR